MLIYSQHISERLNYTIEVMFNHLCLCEYRFTTDPEEYDKYEGPKINYTTNEKESGVNIYPSELLFQSDIKDSSIRVGEFNNHKIIFTHTELSDLPYDPFAATFYMVSRYEEYLPFKADKHGRYPINNQLSYKNDFYQKPIVHYWLDDVIEAIREEFPPFSFDKKEFSFTPSFDIDNAYAFLHKNPVRTYGGLIKSFFKDPDQLKLRLEVLKGKASDPYDTYEYIQNANEKYNCSPIFFVLASSNHKYDKNIDPASPAFISLIKKLQKQGKVGIHPSYGSNKNPDQLKEEINNLGEILNSKVSLSRQHFLKLTFPDTYEGLIENGISDDYSMGFVEELGFRAGISVPYPFFNVKTGLKTDLTIHPFAFMESSFMYYQKDDLDMIKDKIKDLIVEVKNVKGTFVSIWHNESLGERDKWKDWRSVFEFMYSQAFSE